MNQRSVSLTIPITITISVPTALPPEAIAGQQAAERGVVPTREGWFGSSRRSPSEILTDAFRQFDVGGLDAQDFSWKNALATSVCSFAAYEAKTQFQAIVLGIKRKFEYFSEFAVGGTEGFVASTDSAVVVSYRGTNAAGDWWINGDIRSINGGEYGSVHRGFYSAFHNSQSELTRRLREAGAAQKPVVLTGHSLGGAMATIAAAEWYSTYNIRAVYTFGQPAVGFTTLRSFIAIRYGDRFRRFVNEGDIVARVPPTYRHAGKLFHFKGGGRLVHEMTRTSPPGDDTPTMSVEEFEAHRTAMASGMEAKPEELSLTTRGNLAAEAWYPNSSDHAIDRYIERILQELNG